MKSSPIYYHGTKAELKVGDLISPGYNSNYGERRNARYIFLTATLDAAIWGAELARGDGPERIYIVEPTGPIEDDPNLTDKRFAGNPTMSYRSRDPLRIIAEMKEWQGHPADQIQQMKQGLEELEAQGANVIID